MILKLLKTFLFGLTLILSCGIQIIVHAQDLETVKYGGDFLSVGGGARALGMGSAHVSMADDITAGYWNPAGLTNVENFQMAYMHSERFAGIVAYDYGAVALPVRGSDDVLAISFFRQGVDGIKNTLHAWDPENNRPRSDPSQYFTEFSAADMAVFLTYASPINESLSWGASAKILNSRLGPFANAWGYSLDLGAQYETGNFRAGVNLMDITTMMKLWTVNTEELQQLADSFQDEIPTGVNERVPPTVKIGISQYFDFGDFSLLAGADTDLRFEGRKAYYINAGDMSIEPHIGGEVGYHDLVFIRVGVTDFNTDPEGNFYTSPTFGAGLKVGSVYVDYGFAGFGGIASELGFTHRLSLKVELKNFLK
ncbi:MAG: PorV/PorQ family protein [Balneolales bacterium]